MIHNKIPPLKFKFEIPLQAHKGQTPNYMYLRTVQHNSRLHVAVPVAIGMTMEGTWAFESMGQASECLFSIATPFLLIHVLTNSHVYYSHHDA